jgi:hypothetical protein
MRMEKSGRGAFNNRKFIGHPACVNIIKKMCTSWGHIGIEK